ncbi:hypothetical protein NA644_12395 [Pseudomonas stutzeri]|jgi:hypothetical protein|uniref:Uncharacterized protein n=1 Tax=Stutzerimonas stutzeri TaxID=316 RepID=A0A2N8SNB1_STUST|nr:hypothetical protein [Stutzerimonas stutzeri]EQM76413.1 hypothetical protein L686_17215 [Stutzerimonas stutzeri MF28]MCQ4250106.1 hypothetical protein [Stutzerimonas stutzeri]PNG03980.1 hypothetical protein CXL00_17505 [Stutzerimonas stutzeri]
MNAAIVPFDQDARGITDQGAQIDAYSQVLLLGVFSDLCQYRDSETDQKRATELDGIVKRMGKLLERYEP